MLILFNKPYGVITQFSEHENYMSLKDFIPYKNVYPAGRLDADSEGLVILTDNGKIQNQITSPESDNKKTYWVQVENIPEESDLKKLREGVSIKDYITKKASGKGINLFVLEKIFQQVGLRLKYLRARIVKLEK